MPERALPALSASQSDGCADCGKPKKSPEYLCCPECGQKRVLGLFFKRFKRWDAER